MTAARRLVRRHFGADHHLTLRTLARVLATLAWPPAVLIHLWQIRRYRGSEAVPIKRMPGAAWVAMRHNVLPGEYYAYELWQEERRANVDNYLYSCEAPRLFKLLNRPPQPDPMDDKLVFHDMCRAHGLPTPAVLATYAPSGVMLDFGAGRPPECDLFVKSRFGISGRSVERLRWDGLGFISSRGPYVNAKDLGAYLIARARNQNRVLLVQPVISNHASLRVEADRALATVRLVTGRSVDGVVAPIFGFIYFPKPDLITSQDGYVSLVEVENGRLAPAPREGPNSRNWNYWVGTKSDGMARLPEWGAAVELAKAAHQASRDFAFVGWDIALSDKGPILLEGNANWAADEFQSLSGKPLGLTKFADILIDRIDHFPKKI